MIKILGAKRVIILAVLVALNAVLGGFLYYMIIPQKETTERQLRSTRAAVETRRTEVSRLQSEFEQIQEQKSQFGHLEKSGFFSNQDRLGARKTMEMIQSTSRVLAARYQIDAAQVTEDPLATETNHVLLKTPVRVSVDALDDVDFYSFMYWIENAFPGQASIKNFSMQRKIDVNEDTLRLIGSGTPTNLVGGEVSFIWTTMVTRDQISQQLGLPSVP
jgi:hypothetical protein